MMVMMMAMTPSLNASSRFLFIFVRLARGGAGLQCSAVLREANTRKVINPGEHLRKTGGGGSAAIRERGQLLAVVACRTVWPCRMVLSAPIRSREAFDLER